MKRSASVAALAAVGIITTGALALGVAAPASAAVIDYSAYAPTLPYSVLDTLPDEDQRVWTDQTRSGVVGTKPVVPIGTVPTYSQPAGVKLPGILGGLGMLLEVGGQSHLMYSADTSTDLWWKDPYAERPSWIPQDEWNACAHGGDAGNFWDGVRDWMASIQGAAVGGGYDCGAIREDWLTEKNDDYAPVGSANGSPTPSLPQTFTSGTGSVRTLGAPFWSSTPTARISDSPARVEGWVVPVEYVTGGSTLQLTIAWRNAAGVTVATSSKNLSGTPTGVPTNPSQYPQCATVDYCTTLESSLPSTLTIQEIDAQRLMATVISAQSITLTPAPYVDPLGGYGWSPGLEDMVQMTTVLTRSGNRYTCQTAPFKEDAPTIPRPCTPVVPEWEIETERITELVPLKDVPTYVPTTTPGREIQRVVRPGPIQDWEQAHPECGEQTCKVYLMWIDEQGVERNCYDFPDKCAGWYTRTDKQSRFRCLYGTSLAAAALLALVECTHLAQLFEPGRAEQGQAYPDPSKDPAASPGGQTSTAPAPATPPGAGVNDPTKTCQCWPTGWGVFNPFEWVYLPVRCALEWAFVPRQSVINSNNGMIQNGWNNTLVRQVIMSGETLLAALPDDGGCGGIPLNVTLPGGVQVSESLLNSCGPPLAAAAATTKGILSGSIIVATFLACTRYLGVIFGFVGYGQVLEQRAAERAERTGKGNA